MEFFLYSGEKVTIEDGALQAGVADLLPQALATIEGLGRQYIREEVIFPEVIGKDCCVDTTRHDLIVYARRIGKSGLSRFVKDREPEDTNCLSLILKKGDEFRTYVLIKAFFGKMRPTEVWEAPFVFRDSRRFWMSHAYVWGSEEVEQDSISLLCPW